jgi:hypothetical protein
VGHRGAALGQRAGEAPRHGGHVVVEVTAGEQGGGHDGLQDPAAGDPPEQQAEAEPNGERPQGDAEREGEAAAKPARWRETGWGTRR